MEEIIEWYGDIETDHSWFDENWKSIKRFPSFEVSSYGRVQNATTHKEKKRWMDQEGYMRVWFAKPSYGTRVDELVALAFLGEPPTPDHIIDHFDQRRQNNRVYNLRWATRKQISNNSRSESSDSRSAVTTEVAK